MDQRAAEYSRRRLLTGAMGCAGSTVIAWPTSAASGKIEDEIGFVTRVMGKTPTVSGRIRLFMPKTFPNGYTVPLTLDVDTPMTITDHVAAVRVFAPKNPLVEVATFHFVPGRSQPRVSTRIRLAQPQYVVAVARMNDEALLMSSTWVDVATDGCK